MSNHEADTATLYVVATPIGNLDDMVPRAVSVLKAVDVIAAEDTRHSGRLLQHFGIATALVSYHDYSSESRLQQLLQRLQQGESVALISDAGTPLVSDPGYRLVRAARDLGVNVVPIPGACALIAALSASGLPCDRFSFEGFLAPKSTARQTQLMALRSDTRTLIFYESKHRIEASLADIEEVIGGERELVLARELTKTYETIFSGTVVEVRAWLAGDANQRRGEFVLLLRGAEAVERDAELDDSACQVMAVLMAELPLKQASTLASKITGLKKKALYQWGLSQRET